MSFAIGSIADTSVDGTGAYDLLLFALTGESRGWCLPERFRENTAPAWAIVRQNDSLVREGLVEEISQRFPGVVQLTGEAFEQQLSTFLSRVPGDIKVFVDVSCMTRSDMGRVFGALLAPSSFQRARLKLVVGYSIAEFSEPPEELSLNEDIRPINASFAGWPDNAVSATALIVGLGYEPGKADGACEYFDAGENWVFFPESPIPSYDEVVSRNNRQLLERAERQSRVFRYRVDKPGAALSQLASLVADQVGLVNPVVLPFGPKIFFAISLVVAAAYRDVGVWHATGDTDLPAKDHLPSEYASAFEVELIRLD
jgi:hypothetical protein